MNRSSRMMPYRTLSIILIVAVLLVAGGFVAQTIWTTGPFTGRVKGVPGEVETGISNEVEAETGANVPGQSSSAGHNWLPEEIGIDSPTTVIENEDGLSAEDDYMNRGRYLEQERTSEDAAPMSLHEILRQKLTETQADDAPVDPSWRDSCEPAPPTGQQPC